MKKKISLYFMSIAMIFVLSGCASRRPVTASAAGDSQARAPSSVHCANRIARAGAGGLVGTVLGAIAASVAGGPVAGGLYQVAGYMIGLASADTCRKADDPEQVNGSRKPEPALDLAPIREENL